jgi:hypothetical protein
MAFLKLGGALAKPTSPFHDPFSLHLGVSSAAELMLHEG